jgi:excisionase family DNA binding protein
VHHSKPRYDLNEAFKLLGFSRAHGYRLITARKLRPHKDGRLSFLSAAEIDRYVASCDQEAAKKRSETATT